MLVYVALFLPPTTMKTWWGLVYMIPEECLVSKRCSVFVEGANDYKRVKEEVSSLFRLE